MRKYALLLFFSLLVVPAYADLTLQGLVHQCKGLEPMSNNPVVGKLTCVSYIAGFLDSMIIHDDMLTRKGVQKTNQLCPPERILKTEQLMQLAIKYSEEFAELQHGSARAVLYAFISDLYKCSN
jgi:hypothetical protein